MVLAATCRVMSSSVTDVMVKTSSSTVSLVTLIFNALGVTRPSAQENAANPSWRKKMSPDQPRTEKLNNRQKTKTDRQNENIHIQKPKGRSTNTKGGSTHHQTFKW
jgi:hypothetical protein